MAKNSGVNLDITNNSDGFDVTGGTTPRKLSVTAGDVLLRGGGSATVTLPTVDSRLASTKTFATYVVDAAGQGDYTTIDAALTALGSSQGIIRVKGGTYSAPSGGFGLRSGQRIIGEGKAFTIINADAITSGSVFFNAIAPTDIYRASIEDVQITRTSMSTSVYGFNVSYWNNACHKSVEVKNMGRAIYGNGGGYYNEYIDFNFPTGNSYNLYLENSNNEQHFWGGSWKQGGATSIYIAGCNQVTFNSVAFEGSNYVITLDTNAHNNSFFGCRYEMTGTSSFTLAAGTHGNLIFGGAASGITFTDNGDGNRIILDNQTMVLNARANNLKALTITRSGSGMSSSTPLLELIDTYAASGTPTTLLLKNSRAGGLLIDGQDGDGNQTFTVTPLGKVTMKARALQNQGGDIASANDLSLGGDGNVFEITGTTQINAIITSNWQNGSMITLLFTSTPTVKHDTAGGANTARILLAGAIDFAATAGDTLTLVLAEIGGTQRWREVSRAVI